MSFAIKLSKPTKFKKILCFICILLMLFFCCIYVPVANAYAGFLLPFLGEAAAALGLSVGTLGIGLLVVGVIAAGVYVGTKYGSQIDKISANIAGTFSQFWSTLSSTQKASLETAAATNTFDYTASGTQSIAATPATAKLTKEFMLENTFISPSSDSTYPLSLDSTFPTLTDSYVSTYKALTVGTMFMVPTMISVISGQLKAVTYSWVEKDVNAGTWGKVSPHWDVDQDYNAWHDPAYNYNYYPASEGLKIEENTALSSPLYWMSQRGAALPYFTLNVPLWSSIHKSIPWALSNYKQWIENYYPTITVTPSAWVANPTLIIDVPFGTEVKVPAGVITKDGSGNIRIKADEGTATEVAAGTFPVTATATAIPITITDTGTLTAPADKVNSLKTLVTTKFPFSLPWDFTTLVGSIAAPPVRPSIHWDHDFSVMGYNLPFKFDVDFAFLDGWITYFRTFEILAFIGFLINATRRLLGGAQ